MNMTCTVSLGNDNFELHTAAPTGVRWPRGGIKALLLMTESKSAACSQCIGAKTGGLVEYPRCEVEKPNVVAR